MARANTIKTRRRSQHLHRTLAGAVALAAGLASPALADVWSWNAGNGNWMTAGNWSPNGVPGFNHLIEDDIRIGNLPGVQNSTVLLNSPAAGGSLSFDQLAISSGMTVDMNGRQLGGIHATMTGANSQLIVRSSPGFNIHDFSSYDFAMGLGTHLQFADDGLMRTGYLTSEGLIFGRGTLHIQGSGPGAGLINNGTIEADTNGGLSIVQQNVARLDLDGSTGDGQLSLTTAFSQLEFQGSQLADSFSGTVTMGSGSLLTMNVAVGWTADSSSTLNVSSSIVGAAAQIDGGHFTFGGDLNIGGSQGHLRVLADATLGGSADVFLGNDDRLEFDGDTTVDGGLYNLSQGARIDFDGATEIGGGTFNMVGNLPSQGVVNLNGNTQWSGITTINGFARQVGGATVSTPTTINANVIDMDGNNDAAWTINHSLTVNTQAIESGSQQFDGTINMNAGAVGRLTLNLADPAASWTMNGTMNLAGLGVLTTTRVAGSRMIVTGDLNMGAGIAQITADTALQGASVAIAGTGNLRMRGGTSVDADTSFAGAGTLQNGLGGVMLFHSGASLDQVGLVNDGVLRIGQTGAGIASVDRFTSTATAILGIDLGGYAPGTEHDLLLVTGGAAMLGGVLNVGLSDLGGGALFSPSIGDEFTIISALAGVSGTFSNDPFTVVGGLTYDWTVVYNPNTVVLRLDNIIPAPGSVALLGVGALFAARRRRCWGVAETRRL